MRSSSSARNCRTPGPVLRRASRAWPPDVFSGTPPAGAFYGFLKIDPAWRSPLPDAPASQSWAMTEFLIKRGRIGCVPGVDFGAHGEGYVRFCFARERAELEGRVGSDARNPVLTLNWSNWANVENCGIDGATCHRFTG